MPIRIKILLVLHLLAVPMGAYAASEFDGIAPHPLGVVVISLALADAGLLGLWGGLGETRWWLRFGCIVVLLLCLAPALFMADIGRCRAGSRLPYRRRFAGDRHQFPPSPAEAKEPTAPDPIFAVVGTFQ